MSIKEKYNKYKPIDWVVLALGVVICSIQTFRYFKDSLGESSMELIVLAVWLLLIIAPKTITDIIRKKTGLDK